MPEVDALNSSCSERSESRLLEGSSKRRILLGVAVPVLLGKILKWFELTPCMRDTKYERLAGSAMLRLLFPGRHSAEPDAHGAAVPRHRRRSASGPAAARNGHGGHVPADGQRAWPATRPIPPAYWGDGATPVGWGGSIVRGDDGRYHIFAASGCFIPQRVMHVDGWTISHGVADA